MEQKLGIYARQSVDKGTGGSIEDQEMQGRLKATELKIDFEIYVDKGKSGANPDFENRPEMKRLLNDIKGGFITDVFVFDSSRLTRNPITHLAITEVFQKHKITLHSLVEGTSAYSPNSSTLLFEILASVRMEEIKVTKRKIQNVLKNNAANGRAHSGAIKPLGYTSDSKRMLVVDDDEAVVVREIYNLSLQGYGSGRIAEMLNNRGIPTKTHRLILQGKLGQVKESTFAEGNDNRFRLWAPNTVLNILKNSLYNGKRNHNGEVFDAPIIIDDHTWNTVQDKIAKNRHAPGLSKHLYLLKNLCVCGRCGSTFCGKTRKDKKDHFYYCASKRIKNKKCGIRSLNIDTLDDLIWANVATSEVLIHKAKDEVIKLQEPANKLKLLEEKGNYETKINSLEKGHDDILTLVSNGATTLEWAQKRLDSNKKERERCKNHLEGINLKLHEEESIINSISYAQQFLEKWKQHALSDNFDVKYALLRLFIDKVIINFDESAELYTIEVISKIPHPQKLQIFRVNLKGDIIDVEDEDNNSGNEPSGNTGSIIDVKRPKVQKNTPPKVTLQPTWL